MSEQTNRRLADYEILGGVGSGDKHPLFKDRNVATDCPSLMEISSRKVGARGGCITFAAVVVLLVLVPGRLSFPPWITRASTSITPDPEETKARSPAAGPATHNSSGHSQPVNSIVSQSTDPGRGNSAAVSNGGESSSSSATDSGDKPVAEKKVAKATKKKIHRDGSVASPISSESSDSSVAGSVSPGPKDHPAQPGAEAGQKTEDSEAAQLEELEREADQLSSRAVAAADSVDDLRRQQSEEGLGLRGDIATAQELVKTNLDKAQQALQNRDVKNARKYMERAQPNLEKIEKFLGR